MKEKENVKSFLILHFSFLIHTHKALFQPMPQQNILSIADQYKDSPRFLLHSGKGDRFSFLGIGKKHEISLFGPDENILEGLYEFWNRHARDAMHCVSTDSPFQGGIFVFLSYDLIENFEGIPLKNSYPYIPKIYAVVPEELVIFDHEKNCIMSSFSLSSSDRAKRRSGDLGIANPSTNKDNLQKNHSQIPASAGMTNNWIPSISPQEFALGVEKIKQEIIAGNTFQVNFSQAFTTQQNLNSWEIFKRLNTINPSPFSAYFETPFGDIISGSPERLVKVQNGILETKPIAGTRKRSAENDSLYQEELRSNEKEQAEHAMIVDLERNDMGKVCEFGSVQVENYAHIEQYSHVQHLVSTIFGKLDTSKNFCDVIKAMHPGGTITGCPKRETCKIISELEPTDRSIYTGALGYINWNGDIDLNILIRTIYANEGTLYTQAGAGIVLDSIPEMEYKETLHKAKAQFEAIKF